MESTKHSGLGFSAHASLQPARNRYRSSAGFAGGEPGRGLSPQLRAGGFGTHGGFGSIWTDFGCYASYAACVLGCAWEWVNWAGVDLPLANSLGSLCEANCDVNLQRCKVGLPSEPGIPL